MKRLILIAISIIIIMPFFMSKPKGESNNLNKISTTQITDTTATFIQLEDTSKLTIHLGNKPHLDGIPTLWGNKTFYNTRTNHPFSLTKYGEHSNDITEPSWFMQLQYEYQRDSYLGLHVNKEKFKANRYDFGFAGPTDLGISYGLTFHPFKNDWLTTNISIAAGYTIGRPRFTTPWWEPLHNTQVIFSNKPTIGDYEIIGMFTTLIARFDIHLGDRVSLFVAPTLNYRFINDYQTSVGTQNTGEIYSFGINVGVGFRFNIKKSKNPPKIF